MTAQTPGQAPRDVLHARLLDAARRIKRCDGSEVVCASCRHEINDVMEAADAYAAAQQPAPELATLRALHRVTGYFADTWAELMAALPDDYGCEMNCAEANAAADLYRALGLDATAAAIIAAHAEHDDDEERATHGEGWIDEPIEVPAPEPGAPRHFEWAVFRGGENPDDCAGSDIYTDEAAADEDREWVIGGGLAKRAVWHGPWTVVKPSATGLAPGEDPDDRLTGAERVEYLQWRAEKHADRVQGQGG